MAKIVGNNSKYLEAKYLDNIKNRNGYDKFLGLYLALGLITIVLGMVLLIIDWEINMSNFGMILLGFVTIVVCKKIEANYLKHDVTAKQYRQGQKGEWEVKAELSKLPENYTIFCDLKFANKNWNTDFLVAGPTGIFVIEVKSHKGNIVIKNIYETYFKQVTNSAIKIRDYLWQRTGKDIFVKSILVYSSDEASVRTTLAKSHVTVLHKKEINQFLLSQRDISKEHNILNYQNHLTLLTGHNIE